MANPKITSWTRIQPDPEGEDYRPSLEGRVYDPAWLLARQWQIGEFKGEDAGSPIHVSLAAQGMSLSDFSSDTGKSVSLGDYPVNFLAGCEPPGKRVLLDSAEGGAELVALLRECGCEDEDIRALTQKYPLSTENAVPASDGALGFFALLSPEAGTSMGLPDPFCQREGGQTLAQLLESTAKSGKPDPKLGVKLKNDAAFVKAAAAWVSWTATLHPGHDAGYAWKDEYLSHSFRLQAKGNANNMADMVSRDWDGTALDWYSLDVAAYNMASVVGSTTVVVPPELLGRTSGAAATAAGAAGAATDSAAATAATTSAAAATAASKASKASAAAAKLFRPRPLRGLSDNLTAQHSGLPTPLTYAGMPAARWWEYEDSRVNFLQVSSDENDLARLLAVEFALANGNDWYLVPMELPIGALYTLTEFFVYNTFGERVRIGPVSDGKKLDWSLFRQSYDGNRDQLCAGLLLYPTIYTEESEPMEVVQFFRDEMANVAWAMEAVVEGADGRPFDRQIAFARNAQSGNTGDAGAGGQKESDEEKGDGGAGDEGSKEVYEYELVSLIPEHWFPLEPTANRMYQMQQMNEKIAPLGRILRKKTEGEGGAIAGGTGAGAAGQGRWLSFWQGEIPREGSEVLRRHILARDGQGRLLLWRGKQKQAGHGEGSSGLEYDSFK